MYAAVAGRLITGTGFLVLFRHRCSLGAGHSGAAVPARPLAAGAGKVQMAVDCAIVPLALWTVEPARGMVGSQCRGAEPGAGADHHALGDMAVKNRWRPS